MALKDGIQIIGDERMRQQECEGHSSIRDDLMIAGELADFAICYAMTPLERIVSIGPATTTILDLMKPLGFAFKPTPDDRIKELAKAGALLAAEIDRLLRFNRIVAKAKMDQDEAWDMQQEDERKDGLTKFERFIEETDA